MSAISDGDHAIVTRAGLPLRANDRLPLPPSKMFLGQIAARPKSGDHGRERAFFRAPAFRATFERRVHHGAGALKTAQQPFFCGQPLPFTIANASSSVTMMTVVGQLRIERSWG